MNPALDRLPPHSMEAEQGVLGCILLEPRTGLQTAQELLKETWEPFYDLRHQALYDVLVSMDAASEMIDMITLQQHLKDRNQLEALGGMPYLIGLTNMVPSAASLPYYIEIVNEKAYLRCALIACTQLVTEIYDCQGSMDDLADRIESRILRLRRTNAAKSNRKESFQRIMTNLQNMFEGVEILGVIKTGFPDIDKITGGLLPGDHIIISARPGLGKSTLAMNIAEHVAIDLGMPVGYFSLEMSEDKLNQRSLASRSRVDLSVFAKQRANEYDFQRLFKVLPSLTKAKIEIDFSPGLTIGQLRSKARRMASSAQIKLLVVDMLQLVNGKSEDRRQAVGEVSRGLKALAGDLMIPVISISAMNRDIEKSDNRRPRLADLKESGDIESDADVVGFLWQPDPTAEKDGVMPTELYFAKNRNGRVDKVDLLFWKVYNRFESAAKISEGDYAM